MFRNVEPLVRPRSVAVIGASATRRTQGNGVIGNLRQAGFTGSIIPVHPGADSIDDLPVAAAIAHLPRGTDTAVVAIPASRVASALEELAAAGVRSAMVFSNGFTAGEAAAFRAISDATRMVIHGPNCMGLINISDRIVLYPSTITARVRPGPVALIAQSGSAAISLINSTTAGLSKVFTMGSEFQVTAPDYLRWLAEDAATSVIGAVVESIRDPVAFAEAAALVRAGGKRLVVLKVGNSDVGARAVRAHTGAMISPRDAYDCFFEQCGIPVVRDYDELIASVECFAGCRVAPRGRRLGIVGISGGETALASDVAVDVGVPLAAWSAATEACVRSALVGAAGVNPLDLGATVHHTVEQDDAAIGAILGDAAVDALLVIQDSQATLTPTMLNNYTPRILSYGRLGAGATKPVVIVSPTAESIHSRITEVMAEAGVPVLRGLRPGIVALRNLAATTETATGYAPRQARDDAELRAIRVEIAAAPAGPLAGPLCARILAAYGLPMVRLELVLDAAAAADAAGAIGFPLVVKLASADVPHRSDVGGVERGIQDLAGLRAAIDRIERNVRAAVPGARIDGFELQEDLTDHVEAMAGFIAAPPFRALAVTGTGGTLVELEGDRAVALAPLTVAQAEGMIGRTRLGARLRGYRNLMPKTDPAGLAAVLAGLSGLACDLADCIRECDINPVLIRKGSGEARIVDVLMVKGAGETA